MDHLSSGMIISFDLISGFSLPIMGRKGRERELIFGIVDSEQLSRQTTRPSPVGVLFLLFFPLWFLCLSSSSIP